MINGDQRGTEAGNRVACSAPVFPRWMSLCPQKITYWTEEITSVNLTSDIHSETDVYLGVGWGSGSVGKRVPTRKA